MLWMLMYEAMLILLADDVDANTTCSCPDPDAS